MSLPWIFSAWREPAVKPDLAKATRGTIALVATLALAFHGWLPVQAGFAMIAALNVGMIDVRGPYGLRSGFLLMFVGVLVGMTALGTLGAGNLPVALGATLLLALVLAAVRNTLPAEYAPIVAIPCTFLFLMAQRSPGGPGEHIAGVLAGALIGAFVQVAMWPFRPQQPLRQAVADAWLALAEVLEQLSAVEKAPPAASARALAEKEAAMRAALDHALAAVQSAEALRARGIAARLEELILCAARIGLRTIALAGALEAARRPRPPASSAQALLEALAQHARAVALATVSRLPGELARAAVWRERVHGLLTAFAARLMADGEARPERTHLLELLRVLESHLPATETALRNVTDRATERAAFSLELRDPGTWKLRGIRAMLRWRWPPDAWLLRQTARTAALLVVGVAAAEWTGWPHGYWLPFTAYVVLQPDFGATRERAMQRLLGTLGGSVLATLVLWAQPPPAALLPLIAACGFAFAFSIRRFYARGVFFLTPMVALIMESAGQGTMAVAWERLAATAAGGALAVVAAFLFWPTWERTRIRRVIAAALTANREYLAELTRGLRAGGAYDAWLVQAKRRAESSNGEALASLRRLASEPGADQQQLTAAAALVNGNVRFTRALTGAMAHLTAGFAPIASESWQRFAAEGTSALEMLAASLTAEAQAVANEAPSDAVTPPTARSVSDDEPEWLLLQADRAREELESMRQIAHSLASRNA